MSNTKKPPLEKTITRNIIKYLNTLPHTYARKLYSSRYSSGLPDVLAVRLGMAIFIEVKRPGNKPTKMQLVELEKWKGAGAMTIVAYSVDDVKKYM